MSNIDEEKLAEQRRREEVLAEMKRKQEEDLENRRRAEQFCTENKVLFWH